MLTCDEADSRAYLDLSISELDPFQLADGFDTLRGGKRVAP